MTPDLSGLITIAFGCSLILVLVFAAAVLRFVDRRFPRFSRWLDEHMGPDPEWLS